MITLLSPDNNAVISLKTDLLKEFERRERTGLHRLGDASYEWMGEGDTYIVSGRVLNAPVSVFFKWKTDAPTKPMNFELSLHPDFATDKAGYGKCATVGEPVASHEGDGVYYLRAENLLSGKTYYWRVCDGSAEPEVRSFTTPKGEFRTVRVDKIENVRDIGGWKTDSGKYVRQGMVYRGPAFREHFTMSLWRVFMEDLGIKTEIDLRQEVIGKENDTMLGPLCSYLQIPVEPYHEVLDGYSPENVRKIFELLADPATYPVYLHCAAGADRTGTVAFLLEAVLGMSEEDIEFEYNLTAASYDTPNFSRYKVQGFLRAMEQRHPGTTVREKLLLCLHDVGVTDETVTKIKQILLED